MTNQPLSPRIAVYPGSFDPITLGHLNVMERASRLFDRLIVGVGVNIEKQTMFTPRSGMELIREATAHLENVEIRTFTGLAVAFVKQCGARIMVRGVRPITDIAAELTMMMANRRLAPDVETLFMIADGELAHVSSSLIKQIAPVADDDELPGSCRRTWCRRCGRRWARRSRRPRPNLILSMPAALVGIRHACPLPRHVRRVSRAGICQLSIQTAAIDLTQDFGELLRLQSNLALAILVSNSTRPANTMANRAQLSRQGFTSNDAVLIVAILAVAVLLLLPAMQAARESGPGQLHAASNLKSLAAASLGFEQAHGYVPAGRSKFIPPGEAKTPVRRGYMIWILPYLELPELAASYDVNFHWYHPKNQKAIQTRAAVFQCPSSPDPLRVSSGTNDGMAWTGAAPITAW